MITHSFFHRAKKIYRSAYLATSPLCITSLKKNGVSTIINLYSGNSGYAKQLLTLERQIAKSNRIDNYIAIDGFQYDAPIPLAKMNAKITTILKKIIHAPNDVLIHCYAGEHDTGVIFGIVNKCFNKLSLSAIKKNASCHMETNTPYGKEAIKKVLHLIKQYPCQEIEKLRK